MANEITGSCSLSMSKGGTTDSLRFGGIQIDMAGVNYIHHRQTLPLTTETALILGDVGSGAASLGMFIAKNHHASALIEIRGATSEDSVSLKAGEVCMFRFTVAVTAPLAYSDTVDADLEYLLIEN